MALFSRIETYENGEILTGPQLNDEFDNIINKLIGTYIESGMDDLAAMQATSDPYTGDVAQLASNLLAWQQQIHFQISQILGETYWYEDPAWTFGGSGITIVDGVITETGTTSPTVKLSHTYTDLTRGITINHTTSGDKGDGFGAHVNFESTDDTSTDTIGLLSFERNGADNTSLGLVKAYVGGVAKDMIRIDPSGGDGTKFVGPGEDNLTQLGSVSYRWSTVHAYDVTIYDQLTLSDVDIIGSPKFEAIVNSSETNSRRHLALKHKTSGNMVDNFGIGISFAHEDATSGEKIVSRLWTERNGADDTANVLLSAYVGGVAKEMLLIDPSGGDGTKFVGPGEDNLTQLGSAFYRWSTVHAYDAHFYDDVTIDDQLTINNVDIIGSTRFGAIFNSNETSARKHLVITHKTSGNMADNFGTGVYFGHEDATSGEKLVARIYSVRSDADDDAADLHIQSSNAAGTLRGMWFDVNEARWLPSHNNLIGLGNDAYEWLEVWAQDTTINTSDINKKTDVLDCDLGLNLINLLSPISFKWKQTRERAGIRRHYGFSAQQVEEALALLGVDTINFAGLIKTEKGNYATRLGEFIPILTKGIQEQQNEITLLKERLKKLEGSYAT